MTNQGLDSRHPNRLSVSHELVAKCQALTRLFLLDRLRQRTINEIFARAASRPDAFVVQVGAFDGQYDDPLQEYIVQNNLPGIVIEPQLEAFRSLSALYAGQRNIKCLRTAITQTSGSMVLYRGLTHTRDPYSRAIASTSPEQVKRGLKHHLGKHMLRACRIESEVVPSSTLQAVLQGQNVSPEQITMFVCDTEGNDSIVTKQLLDYGARPSVIQYEHLHTDMSSVTTLNDRLHGMEYALISTYKDTVAYKP